MSNRFYTAQSLDHPTVILTGAEAHHLLHVMRMKVGETIVLFDGSGAEADGRIASLSRSAVDVEIRAKRHLPPENRTSIVLASAVPKGERFRWLVEKSTELGVDRLVPLHTERSVVVPGRSKLEKLQQTVIAAAKQSGRSRLMEIAPVTAWHDFIENQPAGGALLVAHPEGERLRTGPAAESTLDREADPAHLVLAVGPEGGLTDAEIAQAVDRAARLVRLGPHVLRVETAAIAFVSFFRLGSAGS